MKTLPSADPATSQESIASRLEFPVKTGQLPVKGPDSKEADLDSFSSLRESCASFDPLGSSSRMFPDYSVATEEETLRRSSGFSWSSAGMGYHGVCLTASFSESPSAAVECTLSEVLEGHAPERFFLKKRAATGILRRAKRRGRKLPPQLLAALEELAAGELTTEQTSLQPHLQAALESPAMLPEDGGKTTTTSSPTPSEHKTGRTEPATGETGKQTLLWPIPTGSQQPSDTLEGVDPTTTKPKAATSLPSSRTCGAEPETKRTKGKVSESAKAGQATPCQKQNSMESPMAFHFRASSHQSMNPSELSPGLKTSMEPAVILPTPSEKTPEEQVKDTTPIMSVRRLTPTECETLQGFPKAWTVPDTKHWAMRSRSK